MAKASVGELIILIMTVQRSQNRVFPSRVFKACRLLIFANAGLARRRLLTISKQRLKRLNFSLIKEQLRHPQNLAADRMQLDDSQLKSTRFFARGIELCH